LTHPHTAALRNLRVGVELDQHNLDDGQAKLDALDAAIAIMNGCSNSRNPLMVASEASPVYVDAGHLREVLAGNDMPVSMSTTPAHGMVPLVAASDSDPWHTAVLNECMRIEGAYIEADPAKTVASLIDWHVKNGSEAGAVPVARQWPKVTGAGRDVGNPQSVVVYMDRMPTDQEMRLVMWALSGEPSPPAPVEAGAVPLTDDQDAQVRLMQWHGGAGLLWDVYAFGKWSKRVVSPLDWDAHTVYLDMVRAGYAKHIELRLVSSSNNANPDDPNAAPSDVPAQQEPEWIDGPHDIEQGMMRNPKYVAPAAQGDERARFDAWWKYQHETAANRLDGDDYMIFVDPKDQYQSCWNAALSRQPSAPASAEPMVPLIIEYDPGYPEIVAFGTQMQMDRLKKWLDKLFAMRRIQQAGALPELPAPITKSRKQQRNGSYLVFDAYDVDQMMAYARAALAAAKPKGRQPSAEDGERLSDDECIAVYHALDEFGRNVDHYEYGLPMLGVDDRQAEALQTIRAAINAARAQLAAGDANG
jgi:hypothetical protein